ncbi:MAG: beta-ketoacyl-[acyl-carrier-protein] synthase family protein [Gammaproteobacteria bacterium]|nr:beta-ketoacyl-[acyl-carrier-protein] synthase family protein [Gammaproteobacteria bacterium]MBU1654299.1 beta-ketoacyl-[acyl-carrier-protein] synthase family protein [Gammaproteobacteria bacterium]MBU1961226.1 beta-ketoacyl-[acyl-carrier-protein] synthase family protein [Gammaproteobacteria bacterium]
MGKEKIVITGTGAVCAAGREPVEIFEHAKGGQSAIGPIDRWDATDWPVRFAGEIKGMTARDLVPERKTHKFIRHTDMLGLYAANAAIAQSGLTRFRDGLNEEAAVQYNDRTGIYVGSGGGNYENQYDYFPLMDTAQGSLEAFGRELSNHVNPMWLLRTLPNNVLCHVGIQHNLKGPNACITCHATSGMQAIIEASEALRAGEAERAVAIGHDAPIEPQKLYYYQQMGLMATEAIRPFDSARNGTLFGEGAGSLMLETENSAVTRGATILGEVLGSGSGSDAEGLLALRPDGEGLASAMTAALKDANLKPDQVGMIVAHANGTPQSDASEVAAIRRVFGDDSPPITGFKWAFGHLIAASGIVETAVALQALAAGQAPGIPTLRELDPAFAGLSVSTQAQTPRSDVAMVISRGFGGTNCVLLIRA